MFVFAFLFLFLLWQSYVINKEVFLVGDRAMFLNFSNGPSAVEFYCNFINQIWF